MDSLWTATPGEGSASILALTMALAAGVAAVEKRDVSYIWQCLILVAVVLAAPWFAFATSCGVLFSGRVAVCVLAARRLAADIYTKILVWGMATLTGVLLVASQGCCAVAVGALAGSYVYTCYSLRRQ